MDEGCDDSLEGKWRRVSLDIVDVGVCFTAQPSFIPPARKGCGPALGFYLVDESGTVYTAYLRGINQGDVRLDLRFSVEITGVNRQSLLKDDTVLVFMEERIEVGDGIVVHFKDEHRGNSAKLVGSDVKRHLVFTYKIDPETGVQTEVGDFVFGRVKRVDRKNRRIDLTVYKVISDEEYRRREGSIIRSSAQD